VKGDAKHRVLAPVFRHAGEKRFRLHRGDAGLCPFHFAVNRFAAQRAVVAALELAEIGVFLRVHVRQPFDVRHTVPARHEETQRRALMTRQRFAVEAPRQKRLR
jgi:hypothetical protein